MDRRIVISLIGILLIGGIIGGVAMFTGTTDDAPDQTNNNPPNNSTEQLQFEHTYPTYDSIDTTEYKTHPTSYDTVINTHQSFFANNVSFQYMYTRSYNSNTISTNAKFNVNTQIGYTTQKLDTEKTTIIESSYYENNTKYTRIRTPEQSPSEWSYKTSQSKYYEFVSTGASQLKAFEVPGVEFQYESTITKNGIKYYVFKPVVVDKQEFNTNPLFSKGEPENVSIKGEILVSEYGPITSGQLRYTVDDTTVKTTYSLTKLTNVSIQKPAWISEAKSQTK